VGGTFAQFIFSVGDNFDNLFKLWVVPFSQLISAVGGTFSQLFLVLGGNFDNFFLL